MRSLRISIRLESLGLPFRRALTEAGKLGVTGVQVDAVGALASEQLSQTGRREFRHLLGSHNLELTALGCPLRRGLDVAEALDARIDHVKQTLALSFDLGPRLVLVQAGKLPADVEAPDGRCLAEAISALARHGDRVGAFLALEAGLSPGEGLAAFLDRFDTGSLGASLDPANQMLGGFDPIATARALGQRIKHAFARDARQIGAGQPAQEVALGSGDIDWMLLLGALEEVEYRGWLTIKREHGDRRLADIADGVDFLRRLGVA